MCACHLLIEAFSDYLGRVAPPIPIHYYTALLHFLHAISWSLKSPCLIVYCFTIPLNLPHPQVKFTCNLSLLEWSLTHSRHSISICWVFAWQGSLQCSEPLREVEISFLQQITLLEDYYYICISNRCQRNRCYINYDLLCARSLKPQEVMWSAQSYVLLMKVPDSCLEDHSGSLQVTTVSLYRILSCVETATEERQWLGNTFLIELRVSVTIIYRVTFATFIKINSNNHFL